MYGRRVPKTDPRVEAYGTVDELNTALGMVRATASQSMVRETVLLIQKELVVLMGELSVADNDRERFIHDGYQVVTSSLVDRLTAFVDDLEQNHHINLKRWATPGDSLGSAALDLARTTCRRAERRVLALSNSSGYVNPETVRYLNRLSDLLWLFARYVEQQSSPASPIEAG